MNPAALKANLAEVDRGATIIVNEDAFTKRNLEKAGYASNPLEDGSLSAFRVHRIPMTSLTTRGGRGGRGRLHARRRPGQEPVRARRAVVAVRAPDRRDQALDRAEVRQAARRSLQANLAAFNAGWSFGETTELLDVQYQVKPATDVPPGTYRNVNGTTALSLGLIAARVRSGLPLVLASYPITPASELLHELSRHAELGVTTIQAEDEIAAAGMALGAAFGGRLGVTATSGPGMDLKAETIGLAVVLELPMIVIDVQRAGPSTGMPTKTEQSDLLMALYGRHGESPLPVIAPSTAGGCFDAAFEAARIAIRYRTPVILLSDTFLASSSEPWQVPVVDDCRRSIRPSPWRREGEEFLPYARDERLARPWAIPGTPGLAHRIGGLEKADLTGQHLLRRRQPRADDRAARGEGRWDRRRDPAADGRFRARRQSAGARVGVERGRDPRRRARARARRATRSPARICATSTRCPANTGDVLRSFDRVLVPELNSGQLAQVLRAQVPGRRRVVLQGAGAAAVRVRGRGGDRGAAMSAVVTNGHGARSRR